jgi:hypothetical protein
VIRHTLDAGASLRILIDFALCPEVLILDDLKSRSGLVDSDGVSLQESDDAGDPGIQSLVFDKPLDETDRLNGIGRSPLGDVLDTDRTGLFEEGEQGVVIVVAIDF